MILPENHASLSDEELVDQLVADGPYTKAEAEVVVRLLRHPQPNDPPMD